MAARASGPWAPDDDLRKAITQRLTAVSAEMTMAALADMGRNHPWFVELDAEHRSWISLVVRAGVDGFVDWFADRPSGGPTNIFAAAPRALMRRISLQHTVELIRTTVTTVEEQIRLLMPPSDRTYLETAIILYSREVAFDAAEVYARAAEIRGAWDARLEALVLDAVIRGDADESVVSRASTVGWRSPTGLTVIIGDLPERPSAVEDLRTAASREGLDVLAAPQGERLVVVLGGTFTGDDEAVALAASLVDHFGPGPVVVGPVVGDLVEAVLSARAATAGRRAAPAWPGAPRPVSAGALLPERALAGDGHARRQLAHEIYPPLAVHSGDLLATLEAYLEEGGSVEATARRLFIHANTVRYRLGKVTDLTGYSPHNARDAYVLRLALSLGRLLT